MLELFCHLLRRVLLVLLVLLDCRAVHTHPVISKHCILIDHRCSEDPDHAKAYFRRAVSRHWLGRYDEAMEDFSTAKRLDPAAADDIDKELARLSARVKAAAQKQRNEMRNFFDRLEHRI
jgi:tetratricopeptide (TPR) repeat protein